MLSAGEFVVNAGATSQPGALPFLNAFNAGAVGVPHFAAGGLAGHPRFCAGGLHLATGGLADLDLDPRIAPQFYSSGGEVRGTPTAPGSPLYLQLGDRKVGPMMAPQDVVAQVQRYARESQMSRGGVKPSWYGS
jgi:hypothetical protein